MKRISKLLAGVIAAIAILAGSTTTASADTLVKFGLRTGVTMSTLKFNESDFSSSNRTGYTIGGSAMFSLPVSGLGLDASLLFTRRETSVTYDDPDHPGSYTKETIGRSYLEIPVNLRWNIGLPIVGKFVTPFVATGPDFSFLLSSKNVKDAWNNRTVDFAWNFGFGLRLFSRLDLSAYYALGINNSASGDASLYGPISVSSKNRTWNVGVCWLF